LSRTLRALILIFVALPLFAQTPDPHQPALDRLQSLTVLPLPDWRFHADLPHPEDAILDDADWQPMKVGEVWNTGPRVLRRWIEVPEKINGYDVRGARLALDLRFGSDEEISVSVFNNGALVARGDEDQQQPIALTGNAQPGQKYLIAVRVLANQVNTRLQRAQLVVTPAAARPDPDTLRFQIMSARPLVAAYAEGRAEREQAIDAAVKAIDFAALERGDQQAFDQSLRAAQGKLGPLKPWMKSFTLRATGNSHIDMAWLWPWTETVEVTRTTFRSALDLIREYPGFTFTMASAQAYSWMEDKYPALFREIQQRVKEGGWEIVGGMWVEPDLNLPDGESLVRQILVGKRYFQQKFGVDVKIGWNPDSFGYSWQLPQIYKKSGMDYFVTQKIYWNDTTNFPYKLFWWESPDGSRLLTYFPHDYANGIEPVKMAGDLAMYAPAMRSREMMYLFGIGDHGGGPTRTMLDTAQRLMDPQVVYPTVKFGAAQPFFDDIERNQAGLNIPTWKDELYFEYHRGVQTTQAETKRRIRQGEQALLDAEKFSSIASLYRRPYPAAQLTDDWKKVLFDEFHDIMPGSGIAVNYADAKQNLYEARRSATDLMTGALQEIAAHVNTTVVARAPSPAAPVMVFNPLSWKRHDIVEIQAQLPAPARQVAVFDSAGRPALAQLLSTDAATGRVRLLLAADVPAMGYATYFLRPSAAPVPNRAAPMATSATLQNEFLRLKLDPGSGCVTSLFDKRSQTEAIGEPAQPPLPYQTKPYPGACGNLLQAFVDKPQRWDAWNIDADFEKQRWDIHADSVKLIENGPLRAVIRVSSHFQNSKFVQDITIYRGVPRVDVHMQADWNEKHILLKVAFPLRAHNDNATYEIPYGSIARPTTRRTPAELAKFEVPALRWADLSDDQHGFSLLNDSKYGYDARGNLLRLSLLRSPTWPDPHADEGHHEFTYSLYPHGGDWRQAETVRRGYELNYPLIARQVEAHQGALPATHSFVQVQPENVVLTAVKKAEDDDGLIFRFYEWAGRAAQVTIRLPQAASGAMETNLIEQPGQPLALRADGTEVVIPTRPYQIKAVKITFEAPRHPPH